jgi:hypothetical protein
MVNIDVIEYKGVKLLDGINTRPQADLPIESHDAEYQNFVKILDKIDNPTPVMIEVGSWWGFWSLVFRHRFPLGQNILVELGKRHISIGLTNFELNNFDEKHYWGGFHLDFSNVYAKGVRESNYDFEQIEGEYWDTKILGKKTGPELDFIDIYSIEKLDRIDLLHADIQGSEYPLILNLDNAYPWVLNDKVDNLVLATHSQLIHSDLLSLLTKKYGFNIVAAEPFGTVGGDGMLLLHKDR